MALEYHVINALVEDKPGVLQKVAGLFTRRGFNIDSITVGESEVEGLARMIITVKADQKLLEQVTKQLNKLVDVIKIDAFLSLLKGYGIKKISRTGLTAMSRGFRS